MKLLLAAINAKYIHSNLAVYSLHAYAKEYSQAVREGKAEVGYREFTINQSLDEILEELYQEHPDVLCFSCYIWNITYVKTLMKEMKTLLPDIDIWLGGPEVSYDGERLLTEYPELTGVMCGEGEQTFSSLCDYYGAAGCTRASCHGKTDSIDVPSICYRQEKICVNKPGEPVDMSKIPFPYSEKLVGNLEHRIIYYESSRGCPFSCSYCLSSLDKTLRFRDLELVKQELQFFIDKKVAQVKFVDRTFNCKKDHAFAIWNYILEHDNGVTNFHFEIGADLITQEELDLLQQMRPGLVQLEIGVQSVNQDTIREVSRKMNLEILKKQVLTIRKWNNINLHLDLIAGLPYEGLDSFKHSFCEVYRLYPDQLQLGFLKVLKGSNMERYRDKYGLAYRSYPPYEVLFTKWLTYDDMLELKTVEDMVENYYNSGQFVLSLQYLENYFDTPYEMYSQLGNYYKEHFAKQAKHTRIARYEIFLDFFHEVCSTKDDVLKELMTMDLYMRENMKTRPSFAPDVMGYKKVFQEIGRVCGRMQAQHIDCISAGTWDWLVKQGITFEKKTVCLETETEDKILYFDYDDRNPLNYNAKVYEISGGNSR